MGYIAIIKKDGNVVCINSFSRLLSTAAEKADKDSLLWDIDDLSPTSFDNLSLPELYSELAHIGYDGNLMHIINEQQNDIEFIIFEPNVLLE